MPKQNDPEQFRFAISLSVLNHLGRNLYRNFITVLGEAISNSWDADARNVWIKIDREKKQFSIKDDGIGMTASDFQAKFLKIGYSKRASGQNRTQKKRPFIGAKGIGKLALLSCAERVTVLSKVDGGEYVGGVIDNSGLDEAIKSDLTPDEYLLEFPDGNSADDLKKNHSHGTIVLFDGAKDGIRNSIAHIRKLLALSFRFSLIDSEFTIYVNGNAISNNDLQDLTGATEFIWLINDPDESFTDGFDKLKATPRQLTTTLDLQGYIASVDKPRSLKISGTEERATIDFFVNGRLRERNILRHIPSQRIVENYIYGQIHFDAMDTGNQVDPFTSSREGVIESDKDFQALLDYLKRDALPKIFDEWDKLRLERDQEGDEENTRKSRRQRKARDLYNATREEYEPDADTQTKDEVDGWLTELGPDAEFNLSSYAECFLSENLVRRYLHEYQIPLDKSAPAKISQWQGTEKKRKAAANISFDICKDGTGLSYLGMDLLALSAEGGKPSGQQQSLWNDAVTYKPMRNVVGHTGLLTANAKRHLTSTFENIKARVKALVSQKPKNKTTKG